MHNKRLLCFMKSCGRKNPQKKAVIFIDNLGANVKSINMHIHQTWLFGITYII